MTIAAHTNQNRPLALRLAALLPSWLAPIARLMPELSYYTIVSIVALAVDLVVFNSLLLGGMRAALAGAAGYMTGLVLHYILSVRYVFEIAGSTKSSLRRFGEFILSGAAGLAITWILIHLATDIAHLPAMVGKIAAVGTSFVVVFLLRRGIVFAKRNG